MLFLRASTASGKPIPSGGVGLIASDLEETPELLREMLQNYSHFRSTALAFSEHWRQQHTARNALERILANGRAADWKRSAA